MDEISLPPTEPDLACTIGLEYTDRVSFAVQQAGTPLVDAVVLTNTSERAYEDLIVRAQVASGDVEPWEGRLARLDPGVTARLVPERWRLSAAALAQRTEGERTALDIEVRAGERSAGASFELDLLAYDQWPGAGILPELTAAFVTPNHSLVAELLRGARRVLTERGERDGVDGYQSASRQRAALLAEACFLSLAEQGIGYINPPASFEKTGQRVRLIDRVMRERFGTCLDLSLVLMGLWEQAGLNTLLLLPEGHAMPAFWTHQSSLPEMVIDEPARIRNLMELGEIVAVESTHVTHRHAAFAGAIEAARKSMNAPGSAFTAIDLKACRKRGIRPLPLREGELPGIDPVALTDAAPMGDVSALGSVLLAERAEATRAAPNEDAEPIESGSQRISRWQSRLLDLSLRNRLINFKDTQRTLPLAVPDIAGLEDMLASEERIRILPRIDGDEAFRREELESCRVHSDCPEGETQKRLLTIYRTALASIEETGANLLHLALGSLVWYETPTSDMPRRAPLVLIPVRLVRSAMGAGYVYTIELSDEPPKPNITLLEKIHTEFGIDARGLAELPEDEAGIDLPMVLRNFRSAIRDSARWEVEESAHLGLFSFNKFLMWRDLKENLAALRTNRLVDHLVERPGEDFDTRPFPDATELDGKLKPGTPLCTRDADSSQLVAVCAASQGRSFVLEGPPGTGKSQTIANMIADALAGGKRVLFVAEKLAALSVVRKRLEQDGLGPFCLELHSAKASKKEVLEQLRAALDAETPELSVDWDEHCKQLGVTRDRLNRYVEELHRVRHSGESLYRALGTMSALGEQKPVTLPEGDVAEVSAAELGEWRRRLGEMVERSGPVEPVSEHPLRGIGVSAWDFSLTDRVRSAIDGARSAHGRLASALRDWLGASGLGDVSGELTQSDAGSLAGAADSLRNSPGPSGALIAGKDAGAVRDRLRGAIALGRERDVIRGELVGRYQPEFLSIEHLTHLDAAKRARDQIAIFRFFKGRAVRGKLRAYAKGEAPGLDGLIADLEQALKAGRLQNELAAMGDLASALGPEWKGGNPDWDRVEKMLAWCDRFAAQLAAFQHLPQLTKGLIDLACDRARCEATQREAQELIDASGAWRDSWDAAQKTLVTGDARAFGAESPGWVERAGEALARWAGGVSDLNSWCVYNASRDAAAQAGLAGIVEAYEAGTLGRAELQPAFEARFARAWFTAVANSVDAIRSFNAQLHESQIERFRALDKDAIAMARVVVAGRLAQGAPSASVRASSQSEVGALRRELEKKRRHMPTRKLIERLPNLLPRLKPCFLMSPLSVAQFLDPSMPRFDIVVFDEASQIPVWDAVGAIARGSDVIVVGDSKQLPPTSFFRTLDGDDDAEPEEGDVEDMESILKECNASGIPALRLRWHYRSRHESLIAFSNYHYYQNELMTFPSPEERSPSMGVTFRHVPEGVYERGGTRTNPIEAGRVVDEVVRMLMDAEDRDSIGVVTFNQAQQTLIQDLFDAKRRENPELERYFTNESEEPVFVKNLENVQGDERDTIVFSVGYGPDASGKPSMNFGPLNKEGGERRLNVAVTRARRRLVVFSSMTSDMIDLRRTRVTGVAHFKQFLDYAQRGPEALEAFTGHSTQANTEARFEHALRDRLVERGYEVDERIGCAGYRIDLAIRDGKNPGKYLLGIECDGKQYRGASTARDRDRTRPSVLRGLGWNLHRVWSTQWHISPDRVLAQIDAAVVAAREAQLGEAAPEPKAPETPLIAAAPVAEAKRAKAAETTYTPASRGRYRVGQRDIYAPESDELLTRWLGMIVEAEAPILQELALRRLAGFCELASVRDRFRERFSDVLGHMLARGYVRMTGKTLWNPGDEPGAFVGVRPPGDDPESRREADQIPPEEYLAAVVAVVREQFGLPREDLAKEAASKLGFVRLTAVLAPMLDEAIERAIREERIVDREGVISLGGA